jgi:hypothetical protein
MPVAAAEVPAAQAPPLADEGAAETGTADDGEPSVAAVEPPAPAGEQSPAEEPAASEATTGEGPGA